MASQPVRGVPSLRRSCTSPCQVPWLPMPAHSSAKLVGAGRPSTHSPSLRPCTSWALKPSPCSNAGLTVSTRPWQSVMAIRSLVCENTLAARRLSSRWRSSRVSMRCTRRVRAPVASNSTVTQATAISTRLRVCRSQGRSTSWRGVCDSTNQGWLREVRKAASCGPWPSACAHCAVPIWRSRMCSNRPCGASTVPGCSSSAQENNSVPSSA